MLDELQNDEKLRLLRFLCSFAWADLEIADKERKLVRDIIHKMGLPPADAALASTWLDHPPSEDELDPYDIPDEHRRLFLDAALEMIGADDHVDEMEAENFAIFEALMSGADDPFADDDEDDELD